MAEAQLTNMTRQKFKEAYDVHTAAIIERAEKQIMLAKHARRLVNMLDDTPIVPGEERQAFARTDEAREVLNDAEASLRGWSPSVDPIQTQGGKVGTNAMPSHVDQPAAEEQAMRTAEERVHVSSGEGQTMEEREAAQQANPPYPTSEAATA